MALALTRRSLPFWIAILAVVALALGIALPANAQTSGPVFTNLTPTPNSTIPAGVETTIAANITAATAVQNIQVFLDGNRIDVEVLGPSVERVSFFTGRILSAGTHTVRVTASDAQGNTNQATWSFTAVQGATPTPTPGQLPNAGEPPLGSLLAILLALGLAVTLFGLRLRPR